jgi:hypothetical protein
MHLNDDTNSFLSQYLKNGRSMKELYFPSKKLSSKNTVYDSNKEESFTYLKNKRKKDNNSEGLIIRIKIDDTFEELSNSKRDSKKRKIHGKKEDNKKTKSKNKKKTSSNNNFLEKTSFNFKEQFEEKRFLLNKEMTNLLGYKKDISLSLNEFNDLFLKHVKKLRCYDYERDYVLVFQSPILRGLFSKQIILKCELNEELEKFLIDCKESYNQIFSLSDESLSIDTPSQEIEENKEINEFFEEKANGWNIDKSILEQTIENISTHSSYAIRNREFFIKDIECSKFDL